MIRIFFYISGSRDAKEVESFPNTDPTVMVVGLSDIGFRMYNTLNICENMETYRPLNRFHVCIGHYIVHAEFNNVNTGDGTL